MFGLGRNVYGLGAIALGVIGLIWGDFAAVWQPVPDALPGRKLLAYAFAAAFLAAGAAVQWRRTWRWGAYALVALYGVIVLLVHAPRVMIHPTQFSPWTGLAEQLGLFAGGVAVLATAPDTSPDVARRLGRLARLIFGVCLISFAAAHFVYLPETGSMVPKWLPPGATFWAFATGVAQLAAAVAILADFLSLLAARALTAMYLLFGVLVHAPLVIADPKSHMNWCGNAVNLSLAGAAWAIADLIARRRAAQASEPQLATQRLGAEAALTE
ncbi:MAG TPA: hypothetical protein VGI95_04400 [Caulobacteraceae bacterium]|jgi:uncharacterized membrane protein YphA (DoxX/SURF4 family)